LILYCYLRPYFYAMNFIRLCIAVCFLVSCKKVEESKEQDNIAATNAITTKMIHSNSLIKVVDYSGLAPLLAKENDTTYVVNFWATWCKPCVAELPAFEKMNKNYNHKKVKVLLVSLDFPEKLEKQVIPYVKKNLKSQVILLDDTDANSWIPKISETWSGAIPATLIYKNKERTFYEQSFTYEELQKEVESKL